MSILEKIQNQRSHLSTNGIKILDFIIEQPSEISAYSSQALAAKIGVSQSSIVKFTQKLGFKGFTAFKLAIIEDAGRKQAILEPDRPIHNKINSDDSALTIAQKLVQEKTTHLLRQPMPLIFQNLKSLPPYLTKHNVFK